MTVLYFCSLPLCPAYEDFRIALEHSLYPSSAKEGTTEFYPTDENVVAALSVISREPYDWVDEVETGKDEEEVETGQDDEGAETDKDEEVEEVEMDECSEDGEDVDREDGDVGMADEVGQPPRLAGFFKVLVQNSIEEFGLVPRDVYLGVFSLSDTMQKHDEAVRNLSCSKLTSIARNFSKNRELEGVSDCVVAVQPHLNRRGGDEWRMDFKSTRIGEKVVQSMRFAEKEELKKLYCEFRVSTEASVMAGRIFEAIIHRLFIHGWWEQDSPVPQPLPMTSNGKTPPTFTYAPSSSPQSPTLPGPLRKEGRGAILIDFNGKLDDITLEENRYYMPIATNNPLFDSFMIDHDDGKTAVISFFQVTVSKRHGGSAKGYPLIRRIIEHVRTLLPEKGRRSTPEIAVTYFLVRPKDKENPPQHAWKMPDGWNPKERKKKENAYRGKVFCLCVPTLGTLSLFTPDSAA